mmetsp:Transcript_27076/g.62615  ORF Transcript_27076/g.62615 Transcript_27076/m.62615 type:complete len:263 (-) Transcript_27076:406-1194(-)
MSAYCVLTVLCLMQKSSMSSFGRVRFVTLHAQSTSSSRQKPRKTGSQARVSKFSVPITCKHSTPRSLICSNAEEPARASKTCPVPPGAWANSPPKLCGSSRPPLLTTGRTGCSKKNTSRGINPKYRFASKCSTTVLRVSREVMTKTGMDRREPLGLVLSSGPLQSWMRRQMRSQMSWIMLLPLQSASNLDEHPTGGLDRPNRKLAPPARRTTPTLPCLRTCNPSRRMVLILSCVASSLRKTWPALMTWSPPRSDQGIVGGKV